MPAPQTDDRDGTPVQVLVASVIVTIILTLLNAGYRILDINLCYF